VDCDLWKFDSLRDASAQVRQAALDAVMKADMVMIAAGGLEDLPVDVRTWIESWPPRLEDACAALVASVGPEAQSSASHLPMSVYLQKRAEESGMEFFCNAGDQATNVESTLPQNQFVLEQCGAASV
jgi:hypothetical protein